VYDGSVACGRGTSAPFVLSFMARFTVVCGAVSSLLAFFGRKLSTERRNSKGFMHFLAGCGVLKLP